MKFDVAGVRLWFRSESRKQRILSFSFEAFFNDHYSDDGSNRMKSIHVSEPEAAFFCEGALDIYFPFISINKWVKTEHKSV